MKLNRVGGMVLAIAAIAGAAAFIELGEPFQTAQAGKECSYAGEAGCGRSNEIQLGDAGGAYLLDAGQSEEDNVARQQLGDAGGAYRLDAGESEEDNVARQQFADAGDAYRLDAGESEEGNVVRQQLGAAGRRSFADASEFYYP